MAFSIVQLSLLWMGFFADAQNDCWGLLYVRGVPAYRQSGCACLPVGRFRMTAKIHRYAMSEN